MAVSKEEIESLLRLKFPDAKIILQDLMGDSNHFSLEISDASFAGQSVIMQHKMVKSALGSLLKERLHAITIKTHVME